MAIEINPNRIRPSTGKPAERRTQQSSSEIPAAPRQRAHVNFIPAPESLRTVIASAVESLRRGVFWERGSILNLLV